MTEVIVLFKIVIFYSQSNLEALDVTGAVQADDRFHGVFVRASANSEVQHTLDRLMFSSVHWLVTPQRSST